jgi:hypothetical protein
MSERVAVLMARGVCLVVAGVLTLQLLAWLAPNVGAAAGAMLRKLMGN